MASEVLVEENIRDGRRVVEHLEEAHFPLRAAMWYFAPEFEDWRLLLASSKVRTEGPRSAYGELQELLTSQPDTEDFPLSRVWLVEDTDPMVDTMAKFLQIKPRSEVRFTRNRIQGHFISDAHIYRLSP